MVRSFQGGMDDPRTPFQRDSLRRRSENRAVVRLRGTGVRATAAGPFPRPSGPWQPAQLRAKISAPLRAKRSPSPTARVVSQTGAFPAVRGMAQSQNIPFRRSSSGSRPGSGPGPDRPVSWASRPSDSR